MKNNTYRQGDVLLVPTNEIPTTLKVTERVTLALGEVTGHHHSILDGSTVGYAADAEGLCEYLEVKSSAGGQLTHQEHSTIVLPKGKYKVVKQVEYTPAALVNVRD